ncbi:MAG: hypothetical protein KF745_01925 [Phycisphaeraceae bacterium]|nr:hypothetical protein [Phycisphaeraceae bacterium]
MKQDSTGRRMTEAKAKAMFQRTLNGWVMDSLRLGRKGLERPSARGGVPQFHVRSGLHRGSRSQTRAAS